MKVPVDKCRWFEAFCDLKPSDPLTPPFGSLAPGDGTGQSLIESRGKHWVSELEVSRHIQWVGQWRQVDEVAAELRQQHPEGFRQRKVICRNGQEKCFWVFTKVVRLKRYGRKRLVIVHEQPDLGDAPRFLLTDALHWESGRIIQTWSYALASEIFHEEGQAGVRTVESSGARRKRLHAISA